MTTLTDGATFAKTWRDAHIIVTIEPGGDLGLFFCSATNGTITCTDGASFDTAHERDTAFADVLAGFTRAGYDWANA